MNVPRGPDEVTADWFGRVVGPVESFASAVVGRDHGWGGTTVRVDADGDVLAVKLAPAESARRESVFYRRFAPHTDLPLPRHIASFDDGDRGVLVMDFVRGRQGDCFDGCSRAEAEELVGMLVELHATWWGSPALDDAGGRIYERDLPPRPEVDARFLDRHGHEIPGWYRTMLEQQQETIGRDVELLRRSRTTLAHGDVHADNLLFRNGSPILLDWANAGVGPIAADLAGVFHGGLTADQFRAFGDDALTAYIDGMEHRGVAIHETTLRPQIARALQMVLRGMTGWLGGEKPHPAGSRKLELGRVGLHNLAVLMEAFPPE